MRDRVDCWRGRVAAGSSGGGGGDGRSLSASVPLPDAFAQGGRLKFVLDL